MNDQPNHHSAYADAAAVEDERLDEQLRLIRRQEDAGELTTREATDRRIEVMEAHLTALRELRRTHLGEEQ